MANEPFKVSAVSLVSGETRIVASAVGTREDLRELFELVEKFPIRCHDRDAAAGERFHGFRGD